MNGGMFFKFPVEGRPKLRRRRKTKATPGASGGTTREASGKGEATGEGSVASGSQDTVTNGPSAASGHLTSPSSGIGPHRRSRRRMRTADPLGHYRDWASPDGQLSPTASVTYSGSPRSPGSRSSLSSTASSPMRSLPSHSPQSSLDLRRNALSTTVTSNSFPAASTENMLAPLVPAHTWPMLPQEVQEVQAQIAFGGTGPATNDAHLLNASSASQYSNVGTYLQSSACLNQLDDSPPFPQTQCGLPFSQSSHSFSLTVDAPYDPYAEPAYSPDVANWANAGAFSGYGSGAFVTQDTSFYQPNLNSLGPSTLPSPQALPSPYLDPELASSSSHASHSVPHSPEVTIPDVSPGYMYGDSHRVGDYNCVGLGEPRNPMARSAFGQPWSSNFAN